MPNKSFKKRLICKSLHIKSNVRALAKQSFSTNMQAYKMKYMLHWSDAVKNHSIRSKLVLELRWTISDVPHVLLVVLTICEQAMSTHPNNGIKFCHSDLFRALHRRRHLLLMLLRQERQDLRYDRVQPLRYLRLQHNQPINKLIPLINVKQSSINTT